MSSLSCLKGLYQCFRSVGCLEPLFLRALNWQAVSQGVRSLAAWESVFLEYDPSDMCPRCVHLQVSALCLYPFSDFEVSEALGSLYTEYSILNTWVSVFSGVNPLSHLQVSVCELCGHLCPEFESSEKFGCLCPRCELSSSLRSSYQSLRSPSCLFSVSHPSAIGDL